MTAILFVLLFLQAGCADQGDFIRKDGNLILEEEGIRVVLDEQTGMLKEFSSGDDSIGLKGVTADAGLNGAYVFQQLGYTDLSSLSTWELPLLWPKMKELPEYSVDSIKRTKEGFQVSVSRDIYTFLYDYQIMDHALALSVTLSTTSGEDVYVNGFAFLIQGLSGYDLSDTTFEFPGSTPDGRIPFVGQTRYRAVSADYASPVIQLTDGVRTTNLLFVNETEKWTAGCYSDADGLPCAAFLSAVEGIINSEKPMEVGTLYLPLLQEGQDPYLAVSDFWEELGYHIPRDSSGGEDLWAVYSAHPYGTMDTGYWNRLTLEEYADSLSAISEMGFSAVWLLPVFQHTGDNVYEPIDQGIIDQRYGGLEQARSFIQEAHAQGVKVLFDFVPHGPRPVYPFAKEHDDWVSKDHKILCGGAWSGRSPDRLFHGRSFQLVLRRRTSGQRLRAGCGAECGEGAAGRLYSRREGAASFAGKFPSQSGVCGVYRCVLRHAAVSLSVQYGAKRFNRGAVCEAPCPFSGGGAEDLRSRSEKASVSG
ncbi:MAG: hypothetical protein K2G28_06270 [Acetatifactor sp.]|nr:hypothetical protein [Acetatifactor sp.]